MIEEIFNKMEKIKYGYVDCSNNVHKMVDDVFSKLYILQSPLDLEKSKYGVCWDQVELERYYFEKNKILFKTYFIVHYDNDKCPTHTFLVYENNQKYYWFEHSWEKFRGIKCYISLNSLLEDVRQRFIKYELNNNYVDNNLLIYEYSKPNYNINVMEFYRHCENGKLIKL